MSGGIQRLTGDQTRELETEVAVIEAALEHINELMFAGVDPIYRVLLAMASNQLHLGVGTLRACLKFQEQTGG